MPDARPATAEQGLPRLVRFVGPSTVLTPALTLLVSVMIARALGPEGRGAYGVVVTAVSILPVLLHLGLEHSVRYWTARGEVSRTSVLKTATAIATGLGGAGAATIALCGAAGGPDWLVPPGLGTAGVVCFAAVVLLASLRGFWQNYLAGRERYGYGTYGVNLAMLLQATFLGAFWWADAVTLDAALGALAAQLATGLLLFLALEGRALRRSAGAPFLPRDELSGMLRFGGWTYLSALLLQTNMRVNVLLLAALGGFYETGLYAAVIGPAGFLWLLGAPLGLVLAARTAIRRDDPAFPRRVGVGLRLTLLVTAAGGAAAAAVAPTLLPLLFGERFGAAVAAFWILLPGTVAFSLVRVISQYLSGARRPEWNTGISAVGAVVTLGLSVVLIPRYGASGAAAATSVAYLAATAVAVAGFLRVSGMRLRELVAFRASDWLPLARVVGLEPRRGAAR